MKNLTPIKKAKELVYKYIIICNESNWNYFYLAKKSAILAVDEIIYELEFINNYEDKDRLNYWKEVKQEIEKI